MTTNYTKDQILAMWHDLCRIANKIPTLGGYNVVLGHHNVSFSPDNPDMMTLWVWNQPPKTVDPTNPTFTDRWLPAYLAMRDAVVNLTPHDINIIGDDQNSGKTYPASGTVARVTTNSVTDGPLPDGTPVVKTQFGSVTDLPDPVAGRWYIVSAMVKAAAPARKDLLSPTDFVRDSDGKILGCKALTR